MSSPRTTPETDQQVASTHAGNWWHRSHPTFAAIVGFFSGMVLVTVLPGAFAAILRLLFSDDTAEELFPFVLLLLAVPIFMLAKRKTRRFGIFMVVGMVLTAVVVVSVTSLVLFFML
ncbi:MAG: hypothetical protein JWN68_1606 [Nocardioides sp.]|jgi:hypothetical protein|uniref:hypothetical protein n=1 Tax=Nocardioides sp. TaxID=35761 RepID=UPI002626F884|nr:hypothetical protein [Nocardioides sp.]MCW2833653.1 hypothetical protein [Nocardioides sp.]